MASSIEELLWLRRRLGSKTRLLAEPRELNSQTANLVKEASFRLNEGPCLKVVRQRPRAVKTPGILLQPLYVHAHVHTRVATLTREHATQHTQTQRETIDRDPNCKKDWSPVSFKGHLKDSSARKNQWQREALRLRISK